jgi:hypothetical protein
MSWFINVHNFWILITSELAQDNMEKRTFINTLGEHKNILTKKIFAKVQVSK